MSNTNEFNTGEIPLAAVTTPEEKDGSSARILRFPAWVLGRIIDLDRLRTSAHHSVNEAVAPKWDYRVSEPLSDKWETFLNSGCLSRVESQDLTIAYEPDDIRDLNAQYTLLREKLENEGAIDGEIPLDDSHASYGLHVGQIIEDSGAVEILENRRLFTFHDNKSGLNISLRRRDTLVADGIQLPPPSGKRNEHTAHIKESLSKLPYGSIQLVGSRIFVVVD